MIEHVHARVRRAHGVDRILVATDDERVAQAVRAFGGEAVMTSVRHASGTDRLAEAVHSVAADIVVNVQGDEPLLDPGAIDRALDLLRDDAELPIATVSLPIATVAEMLSPAVVKVVSDAAGNALYFSRSPIPAVRDIGSVGPHSAAAAIERGLARKHVGLYAYRREALLRFASLPPAPLEQAEGLEQLRALHHGIRIKVAAMVGEGGPAVDTPEDLERVRELMAALASRPA